MLRRISLILFCMILLNANEKDISQKITQNKNALESKKKKEAQINQKLQELGNEANRQKEEAKALQKVIEESEANIAKNQQEYLQKQESINTLSQTQKDLFQKRKDIELEIIDLMTKEVSFSILLNNYQPESIQDLLTEESFKVLNQNTKQHIIDLSEEQNKIVANLQNLQEEIKILKTFLQSENKKRETLKNLQKKQQKLLANYQEEIEKYNKELKKIVQERDSLQDILVKLNILKSQEEEKRKKLEELAKSEKLQPENPAPAKQNSQKVATNDFDVRQVASSYHNISTTKYKGDKTIPPLDNFTIEKRFGPYYDPVYKMKVFNESITLMPKGDDKVKSVLDGKVVFAKDTPILKRVVIIEHKNNMHTIYAQLDKIAPTIKPGSTVKKGYTIGRVENALKFEVTLKDKHIDPLELIAAQNI
ncbi:murein hydrolase activator EnvC family protein [Helicobacter mesocricetorum]|uniref:murein hydrolase activator EnvC family protein n=1 Tax=Helicobacter mesocricetorum TaxID=87012 RepID=UPI001F33A699|nr:peptidoglycan DD-metalloendopeptidase family protein [Helicobacter mesocricetorum]